MHDLSDYSSGSKTVSTSSLAKKAQYLPPIFRKPHSLKHKLSKTELNKFIIVTFNSHTD